VVDRTGHTAELSCLNCGTLLAGAYCHACGQHAHVHRTLAAFGHDLMHGVLHLDGKAWRTLPLLMFRPGELTRRYIAGERARFVSPLAMFLFSVFLMFGVMSFLGSPQNFFGGGTRDDARAAMREELAEIDTRVGELRQQREQAAARGAGTAQIDRKISEAETERNLLRGLAGEEVDPSQPSEAKVSTAQQDQVTGPEVQAGSSVSTFNKLYQKAKANPSLLIYKLQTNAYKFSWLLIIISVPFVALLFLWRWRPLYDHTVFVTYSITAVSILVIAGSLLILAGAPAGPVALAAQLFIPWHMYRQLRGGYELRRFSAFWRMVVLIVFATVAMSLFAGALLMMGVLG
jgi:hypothetical protein